MFCVTGIEYSGLNRLCVPNVIKCRRDQEFYFVRKVFHDDSIRALNNANGTALHTKHQENKIFVHSGQLDLPLLRNAVMLKRAAQCRKWVAALTNLGGNLHSKNNHSE